MKQSVFYRCMKTEGKFRAVRTMGYTEGGIGLVKETSARGWVATHTPTGSKITPDNSKHKTAKQALIEAENIIANATDILAAIEKVKHTDGYNDFLIDRNRYSKLEGE